MCLIVDTVPNSNRAGLVVPCFKRLERYCRWSEAKTRWVLTRTDWWRSPYRYTATPKSGVLVAASPSFRRVYFNDELGFGYVHAYWCRRWSEDYTDFGYYVRNHFNAFAFNVRAYGPAYQNDLACLGLWIPDLDKVRKKAEKAKIIKALGRDDITEAKIVKMLPELAGAFK